MPSTELLLPMFALVVWTFIAVGRLFVHRVGLVRKGTIKPGFYGTFQGSTEPDSAIQLSRNFINLLEAPVLFYVGCLAAMSLDAVTRPLWLLAWGYVVIRVVHSLVHTTFNELRVRIALYFASWLVLLGFWGTLVSSV